MKLLRDVIQQIRFYLALIKRRRALREQDPYIYK